MADRFAERLRRDAGKDVDKQITRAYELAYGRTPANEEIHEVWALDIERADADRYFNALSARNFYNAAPKEAPVAENYSFARSFSASSASTALSSASSRTPL